MTSSHQTYSSSKKHHRRSKNNNATSVSTRRLEGGSLPVDMHYSLNDQPYLSEWKNSGKKRKDKFKETTTVIDMGDSCDDERKLMQRSFDSTNVRHSLARQRCARTVRCLNESCRNKEDSLFSFTCITLLLSFYTFVISLSCTPHCRRRCLRMNLISRRRNCNSHLCCFCFTDFIIYKPFFSSSLCMREARQCHLVACWLFIHFFSFHHNFHSVDTSLSRARLILVGGFL